MWEVFADAQVSVKLFLLLPEFIYFLPEITSNNQSIGATKFLHAGGLENVFLYCCLWICSRAWRLYFFPSRSMILNCRSSLAKFDSATKTHSRSCLLTQVVDWHHDWKLMNWTTRVPSASLSLTYEGALWVNRLCAMVTKIHCMKTKGKRPVITLKVWSARNGECSGCFLDCKSWSNVHSALNFTVYHFSKKKKKPSHCDLLQTAAVYRVLKFCQLIFNNWVINVD